MAGQVRAAVGVARRQALIRLFLILWGLGVGIAILAKVWNVSNKNSGSRQSAIDDEDIDSPANERIKK